MVLFPISNFDLIFTRVEKMYDLSWLIYTVSPCRIEEAVFRRSTTMSKLRLRI